MKNAKITTIKLERSTKSRLDGLREHKRETYDEIISKIFNIINITLRSPASGARILRDIKRKVSGKLTSKSEQQSASP